MTPAIWALEVEGGLLGPATDDRIPEPAIRRIQAAMGEPGRRLVFFSTLPLGEVYGLLVQAFGRGFLASGRVAVVYDRGAGVFFPGPVRNKLQRFAELDPRLLMTFERARTRLFESCSAELGWSCFNYHVAGYAFSLGIRPNAPETRPEALEVTARAAPFLLSLVAEAALDELPAPLGRHPAAQLERQARRELLFQGLSAELLVRQPELAGVLEPPEEVFLEPPDWLAVDLDVRPGAEAVLRARRLEFAGALEDAARRWKIAGARYFLLAGSRHALALVERARAGLACPEDAPLALRQAAGAAGGVCFPPGRPERGLDLGASSRV